jgi:hypothetical protein
MKVYTPARIVLHIATAVANVTAAKLAMPPMAFGVILFVFAIVDGALISNS